MSLTNVSNAVVDDVPKYDVCSVPIAAIDAERAAILLAQKAAAGGAYEVHLCNAYTLSLVDDDPKLRAALLRADLNLADGAPVAWFGRRMGMRGPVRGPSLVTAVCREGRVHGLRHYFYGGSPGVAEMMVDQLKRKAPGFEVAGCESPPFAEPSRADLSALAERVHRARAHIVWIGLGTPRQDYVVPAAAELTEGVVIPVGAAFDFLAGTIKQAPAALHNTGLEWVYRLSADPGRLWKRYLVGNPRFVAHAFRHRRT
jgi:N-acetylglucosaminyldiphosphoundecaprenol N-acetyl-beta-D-mannosaminyltransferase